MDPMVYQPGTILIVDDEEATLYAFGRILRDAGYAVIESATGQDGLRFARELPDLILLDVNLPDVNGYEVCRRIKADPATEAIPILQMSANFVSEENKVEGLDSGADGYLIRPIGPRELLAQVRATLRVRHAETALRETSERLREADRRKDEFLAMLAHELRNPLAPVRNAIQILRLAGSDEEVRLRQQEIIDRQVAHMARLLDDLLDVSRITRGKIRLKRETLDLRHAVEHVVETSRPLARERDQLLLFENAPAPLWVSGDPTRLEQVVRNLLVNAIKYTGPGGRVGVVLSWVPGNQDDPGLALIRVWDTGVGIQPEMLRRVFDLFAQADQSLERSQGGLGIGLTMVKRLVELHGGAIEARSAGLGQGSEFLVRLPLSTEVQLPPPAAPAPAPQSRPEKPDAGSGIRAEECHCRTLVVDDNLDAAGSLAELLRIWGHQVRVAYDGPDALKVARLFQPDVVLMDIGIPGLSGYQVARLLREDPVLRGSLIVALTDYGQEEDRRAALDAGFDQHLVKPVDLAVLHKLLEGFFARS